jgi:hypothetical protein
MSGDSLVWALGKMLGWESERRSLLGAEDLAAGGRSGCIVWAVASFVIREGSWVGLGCGYNRCL